jgi:hypothetical protein
VSIAFFFGPDFKPQDDLDIFGEEFNTSGDYGLWLFGLL